MERGFVVEDVEKDGRAMQTIDSMFCNFMSCRMQRRHSATSASSPGVRVGTWLKTATMKSIRLVITFDQLEDGLLRVRNNVHNLSRIRVLVSGESSMWLRMELVWYKHCTTAFT